MGLCFVGNLVAWTLVVLVIGHVVEGNGVCLSNWDNIRFKAITLAPPAYITPDYAMERKLHVAMNSSGNGLMAYTLNSSPLDRKSDPSLAHHNWISSLTRFIFEAVVDVHNDPYFAKVTVCFRTSMKMILMFNELEWLDAHELFYKSGIYFISLSGRGEKTDKISHAMGTVVNEGGNEKEPRGGAFQDDRRKEIVDHVALFDAHMFKVIVNNGLFNGTDLLLKALVVQFRSGPEKDVPIIYAETFDLSKPIGTEFGNVSI